MIDRRTVMAGLAGVAGTALWPRAAAVAQPSAAQPAAVQPGVAQPAAAGKLVGEMKTYTTRYEDVLHDVARRFELGYVELVAANPGVDPWLPGEGTELTLPTARIVPGVANRGIVINLGELRLYYLPENGAVQSYPIGIGREGRQTPLATTKIVRKQEKPTWYPPASVRAERPELPAAVPPGPENPLGTHALYLGLTSYLIHGTHKPYGVGRRVSFGCIRLYPEGIVRLFPQIAIGTPVTIIDQPLKLGWGKGKLWIEVHPDQSQVDEIEETTEFTPKPIHGFEQWVVAAAGTRHRDIDWSAARTAVAERRGYPVAILSESQS